jgi:hypothetical protein
MWIKYIRINFSTWVQIPGSFKIVSIDYGYVMIPRVAHSSGFMLTKKCLAAAGKVFIRMKTSGLLCLCFSNSTHVSLIYMLTHIRWWKCFRRANFTSADMREADFSGSTFNGAYMEKAVAYRTSFESKLLTFSLIGSILNSFIKNLKQS